MALTARGVEGGSDINVTVDTGATGDMQVVKVAIGTIGSETLVGGDGTNGMDVDVTRIIPGTTATALGKAEDDLAASGDTGVMALAIRRDTAVSDAGAGDYHALHVDALGKLRITGAFAEDAAHATTNEGLFVMAVQSLTRTARSADGDYTPIAVDAAGALFSGVIPEGNASWACSNAAFHAAASGVIKASAGKLYGVTLTNDNAAMQYIMFFNLTAVPVDTTAPLFAIAVPLKSTIQLDFSTMGKYFSTGICWSNSTTFATKTIGTTDCSVEARYL